ncbi:hypothetical protein ACIPJK_36115 [Streptomyces roseus]|uniref:hypothetical protein n=1 Tax=Streptomyces TaxID=1883 RepID=UPI00100E7046|nr:hypothetical protein [Streptomyces sp. M3]
MTHRRNREQDRAVRAYKRSHPGITLDQARQAVAARSGSLDGMPARISGAPLPRPAEQLDGYVQRVATAVGVQRHRAMELLGLQPGDSATDRLDDLAYDMPEDTVQALVAATGMTTDQARALAAPPAGGARDLETMVRQILAEKHLQPGGKGKTSTDPGHLARLLAEEAGRRPLLVDLPSNDRYRPVIVDLDWPSSVSGLPVSPEVFDTVAKALGVEQDTDADTQAHQ